MTTLTTLGDTGEPEREVLFPSLWVLYADRVALGGNPIGLPAGSTTVGREHGSGAGIVVPDPKASRNHASIHVTIDGVSIVDNNSRNGTFVNGQAIERRRLADGDLIRIGDAFLLFRRIASHIDDAAVPTVVGRAPSVCRLRADIARVAPTPLRVLMQGASGAGKSHAAQAIHDRSERAGPLITVNCAAIPGALAESLLFGHKAGAFTGATRPADGFFRAAHGGTLFVDEVGELPAEIQSKFLHAVDTGLVLPVGETRPVQVDVRLVSATNVDLLAAVHRGDFRGDLYARLAEITIEVPSLAARREDVLPLLTSMLEPGYSLEPDLVERVLTYPWPFNIRELSSVARELMVRLPGKGALGLDLVRSRFDALAAAAAPGGAVPEQLAAPGLDRRTTVVEALRRSEGNVRAASALAGVSRRQFYRWMTALGIEPSTFR